MHARKRNNATAVLPIDTCGNVLCYNSGVSKLGPGGLED